MTVEHKLSVPDEAEVRLTIVCTVLDARRLLASIETPADEHSGYRYPLERLTSGLRSAIRAADATLYARPEEPKQ